MAQEQIELIVNSKQALSALVELNKGIKDTEGGVEGANEKLQASFNKLSLFIVGSTDKATKSLIRHTEAIERNATAYAKTPIERLNALRDAEIKKIQQSSTSLEQQAISIQRVTAAYAKMIAVESAVSTGATTSTRQIMQMESALEKGVVNSNRAAASFLVNALNLGPALAAAFNVFAGMAFLSMLISIGENVKAFVDEIHNAPEKIRGGFQELAESTRLANDQILVTNDKLSNTIAKLEHKPENMLKLALDEGTEAADKLTSSLDKSIASLYKLVKDNDVGMFRQALGEADVEDLAKMLGGKTGFGGARAQLEQLRSSNAAYERGATSMPDLEERKKASDAYLLDFFTNQQRQFQSIVTGLKAVEQAKVFTINPMLAAMMNQAGMQVPIGPTDVTARKEMAQGIATRMGASADVIRNTTAEDSLRKQKDLMEGQAEAARVTEQLNHELAKAQEGELSGLQKIKAEHDEKIRQLTHEGQISTANRAIVDKIQVAEEKAFKQHQAQLDAEAKVTASRSVEEANVRAGYEVYQANKRGGDYNETDIQAAYDQSMKLANLQHSAAIDALSSLKEEDQGRARIAADTQVEVAGIEAKAKKEADVIKYLNQQDDIRKKAALEEIDHQQKMLDLQTTANDRVTRAAAQHENRMRNIMTPLGGTSMSHQIGSIQADYQSVYAQATASYELKESELAINKATDLQKLAEAEAKDKETWQKKLDSLEGEHVKNVEAKRKEIDEARYTAEEKIAELQMKQFEEIKGKTEGLLHTLFTNPKSFGKQLETTVRDAALKPVEDKISTSLSTEIYKMLHHGELPGTKLADLKVGTVDDSLKVYVTNLPNTPGTPGGASVGAGGASSMRQLMNLPSTSRFNPLSMLYDGGAGGGGSEGVRPGAVQTSIDFGAGPQDLGTAIYGGTGAEGPGGGFGGFGGTGGGGLAGTIENLPGYGPNKGIGGILGDLKGIKPGGLTRNAQGKITGADGLLGAGLMTGGTMLAEHGLLGNDRGTTKGIFEGAGGGAMIGFQAGGPLGAVIGAAVGAGVGIGEKAAGVESPVAEAKRLVKQLYNVNIDTKMAEQIAQLAASKYSNHISIAVRDPEIRKMLELYAAGTGQRMPQSATTPHAGSLVEQNGQLYQQQTYQYGVGYAFNSNLPVAGSGGGSTPPIYISMNASGKDLANFMTGSYVTPDYVNSQWNSAQNASNGRTQASAMMQAPGLVVG